MLDDVLFSVMQSERGEKMMTYLPWYYEKSRLMHNLQDTNGLEIDWVRSALKDILNQFFVKTATWSLPYWESELGLPVATGFSLELRRNIILAKLLRPPTQTRKNIERIVNQFVRNKTARVEMIKNSYRFFIVVPDDDLLYPSQMLREVENAKPAHLAMYLALIIWHQCKIHHRIKIQQIVDARHNFWNLGNADRARWDGEFVADGTIRGYGIRPDSKYKERQTHKVEMQMFTDAKQHKRWYNIADGSVFADGSHMANGSRLAGLVEHAITFSTVNNNQEGTAIPL